VKLYRYNDVGMFEFDFQNFDYATCPTQPAGICLSSAVTNNFNPLHDPAFRHAVAKMIDHATWLSQIAQSFGLLICDPAPPNLPWDSHALAPATNTCAADPNVDTYSPSAAKSAIAALGYTPCAATPTVYCAPKTGLPFAIRIERRFDDPVRLQFGLNLCNIMTDPASPFVLASPNPGVGLPATCSSVTPSTAAMFEAPWDDVEISTGGWGFSPDPSYLYDIWSPRFAPTACGGGWTSVSPTNYICYVSGDTQLNAVKFAPTASAGYAAGTAALAKFLADLPMYPLYSVAAARPVAIHDQTPGGVFDTATPTWRDIINFKDRTAGTGFGPDSGDTFLNMQYSGPRSGFSSSAVIDYGFRFPIIKANPITSQFLWDFLLMGLAYDTLLIRDPTQLFSAQCQVVTSCTDGNAGAWTPRMALNSPSYNPGGPFDPVGTVSDSSKDWGDYQNGAALASYIRFRLPTGTNAIHWTNGDPLLARDVKFSIEYLKLVQGFNSPSVQDVKLVLADDTNGIVTVELNHQSAWIRDNIGAGYFLINPKAWGCTIPSTGSIDPATCFSKPDSQFSWTLASSHITLGPWVLDVISITGGTHLLLPNSPLTTPCPTTGVGACPGFHEEARLAIDPDVNRDGAVNISDFVGLMSHLGDDISVSWNLNLNAQGANSPRADINNDGKVNIADFVIFVKFNGLQYPCQFGTELRQDPATGTLSCATI
jgi:ABC-type transport system substrate-binding protein